jgi:hypothetical protein
MTNVRWRIQFLLHMKTTHGGNAERPLVGNKHESGLNTNCGKPISADESTGKPKRRATLATLETASMLTCS